MIGRMWPDLVEWARHHMLGVEPHLADAVDLAIPRCAAGVDEAVAIVREYHEQWVRDRGSATAPADGSGEAAPGTPR